MLWISYHHNSVCIMLWNAKLDRLIQNTTKKRLKLWISTVKPKSFWHTLHWKITGLAKVAFVVVLLAWIIVNFAGVLLPSILLVYAKSTCTHCGRHNQSLGEDLHLKKLPTCHSLSLRMLTPFINLHTHKHSRCEGRGGTCSLWRDASWRGSCETGLPRREMGWQKQKAYSKSQPCQAFGCRELTPCDLHWGILWTRVTSFFESFCTEQ